MTQDVYCPYCKKHLPGLELGPQTHIELRAQSECRPIEAGEHRVKCKQCGQPWLVRVVALGAGTVPVESEGPCSTSSETVS